MSLETIKILLVEDDKDDIYLTRKHLSKDSKAKYEILSCSSISEVETLINTVDVDLILLDLGLEDSQGLETLIRTRNITLDIPVVVLTGIDSDELGEEAIKHGAADYIAKSHMNSPLFIRAIRYAIERERLNQDIRKLAQIDQLTGLMNRNTFNQRLKALIDQSHRNELKLALVLIDLDDFKPVNDQYGHLAGDELLTAFATRLKNLLRTSDAAARFGGDEFVALITNYGDRQQLEQLISEKHQALIKPYQLEVEGESIAVEVGVSIGLAELTKKMTIEQFTAIADSALYKSKESGKNQITFADTAD